MTERENPGIADARRMLKARKGKPTEADTAQRPNTPPRVLDGQIDIFGHVHSRRGQREPGIETER